MTVAGIKLDGAGQAKMATLEDAMMLIGQIHAQVERMAVDLKNNRPLTGSLSTLKRQATPLQSKLKAQFGMISDVVTALILVAGRSGGGDVGRVRSLREHVAQIKVALEIAINQTKAKHEKTGDHDA
ncbi:MAG: hypothetical protein K2X99_08240 [Gemmatimonadaceae bacterium]|nr:hypothetical protein [Gemmatimonadaceae bacterium]